MEVIIADDVAVTASAIVASVLRAKPSAVLALPTGETPKVFYREMVRLDLSRATTFNLDEYVGLADNHPESFHRYMREHLFDRARVASAHLPNGNAADLGAECERYEAAIQSAGGLDLCILGVGGNGHIGFNEPGSSLRSRTRIKTLVQGPARHAITVGVGTILDARRCLLLATGAAKAKAVSALVEGPVTAFVPASALQLHPRATIVIDHAAAGELQLADYYRQVHAGKPAWQRERDGA